METISGRFLYRISEDLDVRVDGEDRLRANDSRIRGRSLAVERNRPAAGWFSAATPSRPMDQLRHRITNGTPLQNYRYYVQLGREILELPPLDGTGQGWGRMGF